MQSNFAGDVDDEALTDHYVGEVNALRSHELGATGPSGPTSISRADSLLFSLISSLATTTNTSLPKKTTHKAIVHKCLVEVHHQIERKSTPRNNYLD